MPSKFCFLVSFIAVDLALLEFIQEIKSKHTFCYKFIEPFKLSKLNKIAPLTSVRLLH